MTKKRRHGSSLESLLAEDKILEVAHVEATKKALRPRSPDLRREEPEAAITFRQHWGLGERQAL